MALCRQGLPRVHERLHGRGAIAAAFGQEARALGRRHDDRGGPALAWR